MDQYKDMYYQLFNKITDVIETLKEIQCQMEKIYTETEEKKDWFCQLFKPHNYGTKMSRLKTAETFLP